MGGFNGAWLDRQGIRPSYLGLGALLLGLGVRPPRSVSHLYPLLTLMLRVLRCFQWRWSKRERSDAMENVVSVEDDYHVITHKGGQRTLRVLDAGWRCADISGALGSSRNLLLTVVRI